MLPDQRLLNLARQGGADAGELGDSTFGDAGQAGDGAEMAQKHLLAGGANAGDIVQSGFPDAPGAQAHVIGVGKPVGLVPQTLKHFQRGRIGG